MFRFYINRYLKRDIILLGIFAMAVIFISAAFHSEFRYPQGLGDVRHKMVQCWVLWNAAYAFLTSFLIYRNVDLSYETMLLPLSQNTKFLFTTIRVLIIIPILSALILFLLDCGICMALNVSLKTRLHASSIWNILTYSGYIMHRLPIMPFYLVTFSTIAMALTTVKKRNFPLFIPLSILVCIMITLYGPHYDFNEYNYPFVAGRTSESIKNTLTGVAYKSTVSEIVSWTVLKARMQRVVAYIYLFLLPVSFLFLTYLRFKELETEQ